MYTLTISEASRLVQISRTTMYKKYIQTGIISVNKDDKKTHIDVSELLRVFPDIKLDNTDVNTKSEQTDTSVNTYFEQLLQAKDETINLLKCQLIEQKEEIQRLKDIEIKLLDNKITKRRKWLGIF